MVWICEAGVTQRGYECDECRPTQIVVDTLQGDHIRTHFGDERNKSVNLLVFSALDISEQKAGAPACEFSVKSGNTECFGLCNGGDADNRQRRREQCLD